MDFLNSDFVLILVVSDSEQIFSNLKKNQKNDQSQAFLIRDTQPVLRVRTWGRLFHSDIHNSTHSNYIVVFVPLNS